MSKNKDKMKFDLQRFAYGLGAEKSAANFDVGAGEFSFRNFDKEVNPNDTFISLGNCSAATASWTVNSISKRDATRGTREKLAEVETQRDMDLTITMDESDPLRYALAMYGKAAIKHIEAKEIKNVEFTVSPGSEIFIMVDGKTPAYNYKDLVVKRKVSIPAMIGAPALDTQGGMTASTGKVTTSGTYTGTTTDAYYVKIKKANAVAGTITDAEFVWKKGTAGSYSSPVTMTGNAQTLGEGVKVTFKPGTSGQDYQVGDEWKITVSPAGDDLVENQDYLADSVDVINGKVRFPVKAALGNDEVVVVSCKVEEQFIPRIYAGVKKKIEGEIRFEYDPSHGRQKAYTFYHVSISPNGDDSLIGEDWGSRQIKASVLANQEHADPDNPDSRFYRVDYPADTAGVLVGSK